MKTLKYIIILISLLSALKIYAQDDFDVKLSETEINEAVDAIIVASPIQVPVKKTKTHDNGNILK